MLASAAVPALHNVPLRRSLRAIHSTRLMQTLASIAALARLSALLELSLRVEFQVNDPTYMKSKRRLSRCDSLLCFYKVRFSPIKWSCFTQLHFHVMTLSQIVLHCPSINSDSHLLCNSTRFDCDRHFALLDACDYAGLTDSSNLGVRTCVGERLSACGGHCFDTQTDCLLDLDGVGRLQRCDPGRLGLDRHSDLLGLGTGFYCDRGLAGLDALDGTRGRYRRNSLVGTCVLDRIRTVRRFLLGADTDCLAHYNGISRLGGCKTGRALFDVDCYLLGLLVAGRDGDRGLADLDALHNALGSNCRDLGVGALVGDRIVAVHRIELDAHIDGAQRSHCVGALCCNTGAVDLGNRDRKHDGLAALKLHCDLSGSRLGSGRHADVLDQIPQPAHLASLSRCPYSKS